MSEGEIDGLIIIARMEELHGDGIAGWRGVKRKGQLGGGLQHRSLPRRLGQSLAQDTGDWGAAIGGVERWSEPDWAVADH